MPRPRRDSEILPAKERLENAFWELLSEREYRKITVTDIVRTADVNRNSFYYHFTGLPELADSAILHAVENTPLPSAPNANFNPDNEWRKHVTALLREPEQRQRLGPGSRCSPDRTARRNSSNPCRTSAGSR